MLSLHGVTMHFGTVKAVEELDLTIRRGERRALVGSAGSGKSTVMRLIAGAIRPTGGRVEYDGQDVTDLPEGRRSGIARIFQHGTAVAGLTCVEHVAMALGAHTCGRRLTPLAPDRRHAMAVEVLDLLRIVGLAEEANQSTDRLPPGSRRRLEIAMALAARPRLLLLDEPMTGMTAQERALFADLVRGLPADLAVVLTGGDREAVAAVSSHVTELERPEQITVPAWRVRRRPARACRA
ncbi:ATP-binding cassette domain-containing protein [Streptosporangium sp. CA-135522]|uniref:ATP-binding cassette domain-containing protein n=1 Tax=Streptosporangium sp. CA-135522 TaxID=3240072 RepID=UPI003D8D8A5D